MTMWRLIIKEICHRKLNFCLGVISIIIAISCISGMLTLLKIHDLKTSQIMIVKEEALKKQMTALEDEIRKAMLKLGFNLIILPKGQNLGDWYDKDYASKYMPEEYVKKLISSDIMTIQHLLPILQQKIKWREIKRTVLLIGTRGEVPQLHSIFKKPLVQPVPKKTMVIGYELHQSLDLKVGNTVKLLGKEFIIHRLNEEQGTKDDITIWIDLKEAQELLNKKGLINAIFALGCYCPTVNFVTIRTEINQILPDVYVIEKASQTFARIKARQAVIQKAQTALNWEIRSRIELKEERKQFCSILALIVISASVISIGFLTFSNVKTRKIEIGVLRVFGIRTSQILFILLSKAMFIGLLGGVIGTFIGYLIGKYIGMNLKNIDLIGIANVLPDFKLVLITIILSLFLSCVASFIPALMASRQEPAITLKEE